MQLLISSFFLVCDASLESRPQLSPCQSTTLRSCLQSWLHFDEKISRHDRWSINSTNDAFRHTLCALNFASKFFFRSIFLILFDFTWSNAMLQWASWLTSLLSSLRLVERLARDLRNRQCQEYRIRFAYLTMTTNWRNASRIWADFPCVVNAQLEVESTCGLLDLLILNSMRNDWAISIKLNSHEFYELIWFDLELIAARNIAWIEK